MSRGGAEREREGDRGSEAGSRLRALSTEPKAELEPTNHEIKTRAKVGRLTHGATQTPPGPQVSKSVIITMAMEH